MDELVPQEIINNYINDPNNQYKSVYINYFKQGYNSNDADSDIISIEDNDEIKRINTKIIIQLK